MGRHDQQTTSKRTKTKRHQTQQANPLPNVGKLRNDPLTHPHPTRITKHLRPNPQPSKITLRLNTPTRPQHTLPTQITTKNSSHIRGTRTIHKTRNRITPPNKILTSQQHHLGKRNTQQFRLILKPVLNMASNPDRHVIQTIRITSPPSITRHNPAPPTSAHTP